MSRPRKSRKQKRNNRRTRKQRGGFNVSQISKEFNLNSIKQQLNITSTPVKSGQYGSIEKACLKGIVPPSCFGIKYVKIDEGESKNSPLAQIARRTLEHEIEMMIALKGAKNISKEIGNHSEQYVGSLLPENETPILFTEFIEGKTLSAPLEDPMLSDNIATYYLQTLFILEEVSKFLPGFSHGDLNPGNIFLVKRPDTHPECQFTVMYTNEEGYDDEKVYRFTDPYMIKLIDFGGSECETHRWDMSEHPSKPSEPIIGVWQLDAWMALESFLNVASEGQARLLRGIATSFFGPRLASVLQSKDVDIYRLIGDLNDLGDRSSLYKLCDDAVGNKHTAVPADSY